MVALTGGEALLAALLPEKITTVFGVTGGKLSPFMAALAREPRIRYVGARHEGGAALMAAGSVAATGRTAVVIGECGTGAVNLVPGLAVANSNSLPLLAITSNNQHTVSYPGRGMFAEMDTESLFRPVTKWNSAVHDGRRIPELVRMAMREAYSGRRGAVHLDVPQDVLRATFEFDAMELGLEPRHYRLVEGPAATRAQIEAAVALLLGASRPLLVAGGGVRHAEASEEFRELTRLLSAAATATQTGVGAIATDDEHFIGHGTVTSGAAFERARREADVILLVGCRVSPWLGVDAASLAKSARVIHISTDAVNLGRNAPIEVGMLADAKLALGDLVAAVRARQPAPPQREWLGSLRETLATQRKALAALAADTAMPMHPAALAEELAQCLPGNALVTYDGGHTTFWSNDFTPVSAPRTRFNEVGMTQLGFGLPFAIALKLHYPAQPVINITGDGAFGFTLQELDTARRYALPVVNVIHNNAAWGVIKVAHQRGYGFTLGDDLEGTDYAAIARGFGGFGEVVTERGAVRGALERAIASGLPAVIDCRVRFEPHPSLPDFGRMGAVGLPPPAAGARRS